MMTRPNSAENSGRKKAINQPILFSCFVHGRRAHSTDQTAITSFWYLLPTQYPLSFQNISFWIKGFFCNWIITKLGRAIFDRHNRDQTRHSLSKLNLTYASTRKPNLKSFINCPVSSFQGLQCLHATSLRSPQRVGTNFLPMFALACRQTWGINPPSSHPASAE